MISISLSLPYLPPTICTLSSLFPHAQEKRPASYLLLHLLHSSSPPLSSRSTLQFLDLGGRRRAASPPLLEEPMAGCGTAAPGGGSADVAAEAQEDAGAAVHETIAAAAA